MRKILFASCFLIIFILPMIGFGEDMKWSGVLYLKGTGATNCGKSRISNEAWDKCENWAMQSIKGDEKPVIKDIELYNIAVENDKGPSWNPKLNCNFRASVKCGYRLEKISAADKLKLSKGKGAASASCGEPTPEEKVAKSDCEVGTENKKPMVVKAEPKEKPSVPVAAAAVPPVVLPPPVPRIEAPFAVSKVVFASSAQNNKDNSPKQPEAAPKTALKWSEQLSMKGDGITNCSNSRINSEAWEICEAWAVKKKGKKGFTTVKPEVKDLDISNIKVETGKPTTKDPNPSCSFQADLKCGYSAIAYIVEHSADTISAEKDQKDSKKKKSDLNNLFGDGLRWSELISIEGTGVTNCSKSRINNEAWEKCEAWAAQQKKQAGALRPVIKNVELYNIASESDKGTSWAPKESCSFHATMKCGYKME